MQHNDNNAKTRRVYHFTTCEVAKLILQGKRLKLSNIKNLNDPFDFRVFKHRNVTEKEAWSRTINHIASAFGTISFSANNTNPVQWAHYAESHTGVCLGFDIIEPALKKVRYFNNRIKFPLNPKEKDFMKAFTTKFKHWQYEEEFRAVAPKQESDADGNFYLNLNSEYELKEVIIGYKSDMTKNEIIPYIHDNEVNVYKAFPDENYFEMKLQQV